MPCFWKQGSRPRHCQFCSACPGSSLSGTSHCCSVPGTVSLHLWDGGRHGGTIQTGHTLCLEKKGTILPGDIKPLLPTFSAMGRSLTAGFSQGGYGLCREKTSQSLQLHKAHPAGHCQAWVCISIRKESRGTSH